MNLDCWGCGKKPPKDGPLFLVCPKCRDHKLIKCNFCSQECFKANWARHEEWHKEQRKNARRLRKTTPKKEWGPMPRGLSADEHRKAQFGMPVGTTNTYALEGMEDMSPDEYMQAMLDKQMEERRQRRESAGGEVRAPLDSYFAQFNK